MTRWEKEKIEQEGRRETRLQKRILALYELRLEGFLIAHVRDDVYLVNKLVNVSLLHNEFRNIKTNERGNYKEVRQFLREYIERFRKIDYVVHWHKPPPVPKLLAFLAFLPPVFSFLRAYNVYRCVAVKYHKDEYQRQA